ncbi:MAG TPA: hypothetical protein VEA37_12205 [Flavobacterium sp.]|nr:hypothetical protein [Flavobacterium sp.]
MNKRKLTRLLQKDFENLLLQEIDTLETMVEAWYKECRKHSKEANTLREAFDSSTRLLSAAQEQLAYKIQSQKETEELYVELRVLYDKLFKGCVCSGKQGIMKTGVTTFKVYDEDDKIIHTAIVDARKVQDFLWGEDSLEIDNPPSDPIWIEIFQKRVDKMKQINWKSRNAVVELRKRVLQQAALSCMLLKRLLKERI